MEYTVILIAVLLISPFILKFAASQDNKTKHNLKYSFLLLLGLQLASGFLNWETFQDSGRNAFELTMAFPSSLLGLFFLISIIQILLLLFYKSFNTLAVILNFVNSVLIFASMIRLSNLLGFQVVSFASIGTIFLVLIGNVIALAFINKDKNLLKKYP